jgi:hypothetical protein
MKRFARMLAGVAGVLLALSGGIIALGNIETVRRARPFFGADLFAEGFYAAVTAGGVVLVLFAWPGLFGRLWRSAVGALTSWTLVCNPLVHGIMIYAAGTIAAAVAGRASLFVVLLFTTFYAVASPALIALRPRWWLNALLSLVVGIALVGVLTGTGEAVSRQHYGDDAMVMLFPVRVYPWALGASLVVRLVAQSRRKAAAARQ